MDRRAFLAGMAALLTARRAAEALQPRKPRIGWLTSSIVHQRNVNAFREGMRTHGHGDITLEVRAARGDLDRLPALAADLVAAGVDVIVTDGGPALIAAKNATTTTPIVIGAAAADLVAEGIVTTLARPGGNVTGFPISTGPELYGKRMELLREAIPGLTRVAVVRNARNDISRTAMPSIVKAAAALALGVDLIEVRDLSDIERAIGSAGGGKVGAMLMVADASFWSERGRIVALAARQRLPAMYPEVEFVEAGGLMSYGPNVPENFRRAAGYVDKILNGVNPKDLPIELPARLDLVINVRTARGLKLTLPASLLARAAQVIE
jgi:putative tryptophan/tyrosine transport system substrate-binding protein